MAGDKAALPAIPKMPSTRSTHAAGSVGHASQPLPMQHLPSGGLNEGATPSGPAAALVNPCTYLCGGKRIQGCNFSILNVCANVEICIESYKYTYMYIYIYIDTHIETYQENIYMYI